MKNLTKRIKIFLRLKKEELLDIWDEYKEFFLEGLLPFIIFMLILLSVGVLIGNLCANRVPTSVTVIAMIICFLSGLFYVVIPILKWLHSNWVEAGRLCEDD